MPIIVSGSETAAIAVTRQSRRKNTSTSTARKPPIRMASRTFATALRTNSARSYTTCRRTDGGSDGRYSLSAAQTPSATCRMLPRIWRATLMSAAGSPFPLTSVTGSITPSRTSARSPR